MNMWTIIGNSMTVIGLSACFIIQAFWLRDLSRRVRYLELWIIINDGELRRKNEESPSDLAYMKEKGFI